MTDTYDKQPPELRGLRIMADAIDEEHGVLGLWGHDDSRFHAKAQAPLRAALALIDAVAPAGARRGAHEPSIAELRIKLYVERQRADRAEAELATLRGEPAPASSAAGDLNWARAEEAAERLVQLIAATRLLPSDAGARHLAAVRGVAAEIGVLASALRLAAAAGPQPEQTAAELEDPSAAEVIRAIADKLGEVWRDHGDTFLERLNAANIPEIAPVALAIGTLLTALEEATRSAGDDERAPAEAVNTATAEDFDPALAAGALRSFAAGIADREEIARVRQAVGLRIAEIPGVARVDVMIEGDAAVLCSPEKHAVWASLRARRRLLISVYVNGGRVTANDAVAAIQLALLEMLEAHRFAVTVHWNEV